MVYGFFEINNVYFVQVIFFVAQKKILFICLTDRDNVVHFQIFGSFSSLHALNVFYNQENWAVSRQTSSCHPVWLFTSAKYLEHFLKSVSN